MSYLYIFGLNFVLKKIVIFEISTLEFVYSHSFAKKQKFLSWVPKVPYLGIFWTAIWERYRHIWNQCPWIRLIAKFDEKIKILKLGTKNAWFGYFWCWNLKAMLSYLNSAPSSFSKSTPSNLSNCKI